MNSDNFMRQAIEISIENVRSSMGGPFGAVIVRNGVVIATGANSVTRTDDPTAHAEIVAIRNACKTLGTFQLTGCTIYSSCEPCPMCLGALYWARIEQIFFANTRKQAAGIGFDDEFLYTELIKSIEERSIPTYHVNTTHAYDAFALWERSNKKVEY